MFNRSGEVYKTVIHDPDRTQGSNIGNVQDINRGAIHNVLEWTARFALRLKHEFPLSNATGHLLKEWGRFLGIPNDSGLSDEGYRQSILGKILAIAGTLPVIRRLIGEDTRTEIREAHEIGLYLDNAFLDTSVDRARQVGSVFTHPRNAIYVIFDTYADVSTALLELIAKLKIAGVGLYAGVIATEVENNTVFLSEGFLDRDYLG